jgi:helicase MOV-10
MYLYVYVSRRILACAPSDAATDVMCIRLVSSMSNEQLLRLNWYQRSVASVPNVLLSYCHQVDGLFDIPSIDKMLKYQVIYMFI